MTTHPTDRTPEEQQARERYPSDHAMDTHYMDGVRDGFAECLRERAIPAEAEVKRLRETVQVLVDALAADDEALKHELDWSGTGSLRTNAAAALSLAALHSITPKEEK